MLLNCQPEKSIRHYMFLCSLCCLCPFPNANLPVQLWSATYIQYITHPKLNMSPLLLPLPSLENISGAMNPTLPQTVLISSAFTKVLRPKSARMNFNPFSDQCTRIFQGFMSLWTMFSSEIYYRAESMSESIRCTCCSWGNWPRAQSLRLPRGQKAVTSTAESRQKASLLSLRMLG